MKARALITAAVLAACTPAAAPASPASPSATPRSNSMSHAHYAEVNGLRMYYEDQGQGPALVLIHGGGSTAQTSFSAILPLLARAHRVIAVEQQGHGHTADIDRPFSFEQMADDTAALLAQLHLTTADILGFSNGGMTTLQLAVRHPALVRRLVICSGFYARAGFIPMLRTAFDQPPNPDHMPRSLRDAYLAAAPHPDLQKFVAKGVALMKSFKDLPEDKLRAIEAPTLVMQGDQDVILPEHAAQLARLVKHGQLAIFPNTRHGEYLGVAEFPSSNPRLFDFSVATIESFLAP